MEESFTTKSLVPSFRPYSEPHMIDSTLDQDLVSTNNHRNEKLNELSQVDCDNNNIEAGEEDEGEEEEEDEEELDDDWLSKLINSKDLRVPPVDGTASDFGLNFAEIPLLGDDDLDFREKTMRTLRVGLKKIWRRGSATITAEDPTYKVAYLGNVLTGWAKGEGCIEKPLGTLWKNYNSSTKPDVQMKIKVTQSGLKAVTKDHGLIEYWSHRITYCTVASDLPRIFCWVYRHEGRKLKPELRCHAVLCSKESIAKRMAATLKLRLAQALIEFKRNKLLRQKARLSLANSVYDNPSLPRRKILLSTGSHNYKPPLERSKSAPKLTSIEESLEEEESSPKVKRKLNGEGCVTDEEYEEKDEAEPKKSNTDEKCEYKLMNLNFVKKLCSSIENLVESTSNYSKKFLSERKSGKDVHLTVKKPEGIVVEKRNEEDEVCVKSKPKKNVTFDVNRSDGSEFAMCTEYKKLEEDAQDYKDFKIPEVPVELESKDQESDEGSHSLQSMSSCCSDVSSLMSEKSANSEVADGATKSEIPGKIFRANINSHGDIVKNEGTFPNKVFLHPTGKEEKSRKETHLEEGDSLSEEEEEEGHQEEDVVSDESGYVELENLTRRLNLDRKEKDVPHHKIIKSTLLRPREIQPSCLQI